MPCKFSSKLAATNTNDKFSQSVEPIRFYVKSQDRFKMLFKFKFCSFVSVTSLFKKEINAFDLFGIEWLAVTVLSVDVKYGNTLMIMIKVVRNKKN